MKEKFIKLMNTPVISFIFGLLVTLLFLLITQYEAATLMLTICISVGLVVIKELINKGTTNVFSLANIGSSLLGIILVILLFILLWVLLKILKNPIGGNILYVLYQLD